MEALRRTAAESLGRGLIVRSLVGMDRGAPKKGMAKFLAGKTLFANQIVFINLIVNHLTEQVVMEPDKLFESPFTDLAPRGPDELFTPSHLDELIRSLEAVRTTAVAA